MKKVKFIAFPILLASFIDSFDACNVSSSIIVFMSILFGFTSTSFSFVIFSDVAKKLYAKSSEYNSSNEFYDVVRVYERSFIFSFISIIIYIFSKELYSVLMSIYVIIVKSNTYFMYLFNFMMLIPVCLSIYFFIKIIELSINFSVYLIRNR